MIDAMLAGGGLVILGVVVGWFLPVRRISRASSKTPRPLCGCDHELSFHDPASGKCHALLYVPPTQARMSHHVPCPCRQYSGPQPLPEFYAPEIT
jgi:hypothetical protein